MTALPFLASPTHDKSSNPSPFATAAFAGHVLTGGYACTCGCPACICEPGESPLECGQENMAISDKTNQIDSPVGAASSSGFEMVDPDRTQGHLWSDEDFEGWEHAEGEFPEDDSEDRAA